MSLGQQESIKFGDLKFSCVSEIKMLSHRLGEQSLMETRETRVFYFFSVRTHRRVGDKSFLLWH